MLKALMQKQGAGIATLFTFFVCLHLIAMVAMGSDRDLLIETLRRDNVRDTSQVLQKAKVLEDRELEEIPMQLLLRNLRITDTNSKRILLSMIGRKTWANAAAEKRLLEIARNPKEESSVRSAAIYWLADHCQGKLDVLKELAIEGNRDLRLGVAVAISRLDGDVIALHDLQSICIVLFADTDSEVRSATLEAFAGVLALSTKARKFTFRFEGDQARAYYFAARVRVNPADTATSDELARMLVHKKRMVREVAADGLAECEKFSDEALTSLLRSLSDESPIVKVGLCRAIERARWNDRLAVTNLAACLKDRDSSVRAYAAIAIGRHKIKTYTKEIASLLRDDDSLTRAMALSALALMGDRSVVPAIQHALSEGLLDDEDCKIAFKALMKE